MTPIFRSTARSGSNIVYDRFAANGQETEESFKIGLFRIKQQFPFFDLIEAIRGKGQRKAIKDALFDECLDAEEGMQRMQEWRESLLRWK